VLLVPEIQKNLFSVGACAKKGYLVFFEEQKVVIKKNRQVQTIGYKQANDIYRLMFKVTSNDKNNDKLNEVNLSATLQVWHERLGHININMLKNVVERTAIQGIKFSNTDKFFCEPCQYGKAHRLSFKKGKSEQRHWQPGEYIHTDICGPFSEISVGGSRYYLLFVDESTNHRSVFFIKHKSDVLEKLKEFNNIIKNKFGYNIKVIRADNGRKYVNQHVNNYLSKLGIIMENTALYTRAKRKSRKRKPNHCRKCTDHATSKRIANQVVGRSNQHCCLYIKSSCNQSKYDNNSL